MINEYADLYCYKDFETMLSNIARTGGKYSISTLIATQRPDVKIITPKIRSNFSSTIAFRVASKVNVRLLEAPRVQDIPVSSKGLVYFVSERKNIIQAPLAGKLPRPVDRA